MADHTTRAALSAEASGALLVALSALTWSVGGLLARLADVDNAWQIVFWRSGTATLFLLGFMLWRGGLSGTKALFAGMGWPGLAVAGCFCTSSMLFVLALNYTSVANVVLMGGAVPLMAALLSWAFFGERLQSATWIAIFAVIVGVAIMVSDSLSGAISPVGDGLAIIVAFGFAAATVLSRRYASIRMTPAVCTGAALGCVLAFFLAMATVGTIAVPLVSFGWLVAFGVSMGLGLALFASGVRLIQSALAALLGTGEIIFGPIWVWLVINEVPNTRTIIGGTIVLVSLMAYLSWQMLHNQRAKPAITP